MIVRRPLADRAAARGEDPLEQEGSPVHVPVTVEPPAGRCTVMSASLAHLLGRAVPPSRACCLTG